MMKTTAALLLLLCAAASLAPRAALASGAWGHHQRDAQEHEANAPLGCPPGHERYVAHLSGGWVEAKGRVHG